MPTETGSRGLNLSAQSRPARPMKSRMVRPTAAARARNPRWSGARCVEGFKHHPTLLAIARQGGRYAPPEHAAAARMGEAGR
jgi:hypothetical protein